MLNLTSLNSLPLILMYVVSGFIIVSVRSQFLMGRGASQSTPLLVYVTASLIYDAITYPLIAYIMPKSRFGFVDILIWFVLIVVFPAPIGFLFGRMGIRRNWLHEFLRSCGFNKTIHPMEPLENWVKERLENLKSGPRQTLALQSQQGFSKVQNRATGGFPVFP